jgi:hypothetical protein
MGLGRVKTRHRSRDVKYSSKQQAKYTIKQHHGSQSRVLMEYYSSVAKRDGVFTRPRSCATDALGVHFDDVRSAPKADIRFQRRMGRDGPKPKVAGAGNSK